MGNVDAVEHKVFECGLLQKLTEDTPFHVRAVEVGCRENQRIIHYKRQEALLDGLHRREMKKNGTIP